MATAAKRRRPLAPLGVLALLAVVGGAAAWLLLRPPRHPNLLLVTIDTLRADHVGAYGHAGASTPVMDGLARRGTRFENAETTAPLTGPAHATILTGLYPPVHGVRDNVVFPLDGRHPTLATHLKKKGYRTAALVAAYPVAAAFGFNQGFDHFSENFHEAPQGGQGAERPANEVAEEAVRWLEGAGKGPFFLWAHLYDPHTPYRPPPPFDTQFKDRPYDGEIAFADSQLGRILDRLRASGRDRDTVVAVVGDHGESLGEHNEATHAVLIYQSTLRVPFILSGPGVPAGRVVETRVGAVDILPTVMRLLGFEPPQELRGLDLGPTLRGDHHTPPPLYAESLFGRLNCRWASLRAWMEADWKLIDGAKPELFNLVEDPSERRNRAEEEPARVARMQAALQAALRKMAPQGDAARPVALSPEQEERLRSLGYVGGSGGGGSLDEPGLPDPRTHVHLYERLQVAMTARGPAAKGAIQEIAAIAEVDPGNPYAHFALGTVAYHEGRLPLAAQAFAKAVVLDPDRPGMRLPYGRLLREMGRLEDSERQLRIAAGQTTPDDVRTPVALAETLIARGHTAEAEGLIAPVLARSPDHIEALAARAHLLVAQGRVAEALPVLERLGAGSDPEPWIELARLHLRLGESARAREASAQALRRSPQHPWALAISGHALIAEGRRAEGLGVLQKALAAHPRRPEAWLSLARAFEAAGERAQAAACRREASAIGSS